MADSCIVEADIHILGEGLSTCDFIDQRISTMSLMIAAEINKALEEFFPPACGVCVIAEPGRYYVTSAVTLAANVIAKKVIVEEPSSFNGDQLTVTSRTSGRTVKRTMMYYLNEGVHGSMSMLLLDPVQSTVSPYPHRKFKPDEPVYPGVIWGPTCDSLDVVVKNILLPELEVGDWFLIDNMGAYTHSLSTTFNGFKKTPIYCVMSHDTTQMVNSSRHLLSHNEPWLGSDSIYNQPTPTE